MIGLNLEMLKSTGRLSELRDRMESGRASLVAQMVKNLPAMQEIWVRSLGQEDPVEKVMATYSSILAWRIPWTEQPCGLWTMGSQSWTCLSN